MVKHPTSSRVHRDKNQPDDPFVAGVERTFSWARENSRVLIVGAIAVAVLVAGALYYINYQRSMERQAAARFTEIQGTAASGNTQLAIRDLQSFVERFGDTAPGRQARLILGQVLLQEDRPEEALQAVQPLSGDLGDGDGLAAARIAAAAHEATGNVEEAVDIYLDVADGARFDFERRDALEDAARVYLQNGDPGAAVDLYERILDTFGQSESGRGYYEMWLAEARAQAGEGMAAQPAGGESAEPAAADNG